MTTPNNPQDPRHPGQPTPPPYPQQGGYQSGYQQGHPQHGYPQPGYQQPGYQQPGYQQGYTQPGYAPQGQPDPGYAPQAYGAVPPAPQPPEKKSKKGWIIGILVAVIAICGISVVATGGGDDATSPTTTAGPGDTKQDAPTEEAKDEDKDEDKTAGMNQPVRDGKFEFVVKKVQTGLSSLGESFMEQKAQGQFVVVTVTVKNIGNKSQGFSPSAQKLIDTQGREHEADVSAALLGLDGSGSNPIFEDINPGNKVTGKLVFDIPNGAVPETIVLHDSMFSGGAKVSLKR